MSRNSRVKRNRKPPTRRKRRPKVQQPKVKKSARRAIFKLVFLAALLATGLVYVFFIWGRSEDNTMSPKDQEKLQSYSPDLWSGWKKSQVTSQQKVSPYSVPVNLSFEQDNKTIPVGSQPYHFHFNVPKDRTIATIRAKLLAAPKLELNVRSTRSVDNDAEQYMEIADPKTRVQGDMAKFYAYAMIHNVPEHKIKHDSLPRIYSTERSMGFFTPFGFKPLWQMTFQHEKKHQTVYFGPGETMAQSLGEFWAKPNDKLENYSSYHDLHGSYIFVRHFSKTFEQASKILASGHPDIKYNNARGAITHRVFQELMMRDAKDLWQDWAAAYYSNSPTLEEYEELKKHTPVGIVHGNILIDHFYFVWRIASATYRYNLDRQAFGPAQIIVGLARAAGQNKHLVKRYNPHLTAADFANSKAIVKATLDAKKAIFLRAMTLDYILTRLKQTAFRDPEMTYPANQPPFIADAKVAREYGLLYLASLLSTFPEFDRHIPDLITSQAHSVYCYYGQLYSVASYFDIKPDFPTMFIPRVEIGNKFVIYNAYEVRKKID